MNKLFTSESVTEGHPDKVADQISDAILDALLEQDPDSRVAAETIVSTGLVLVIGEVTSKAVIDISEIARETIRTIGYTSESMGFSADSVCVLTQIDKQSTDIAIGIDKSYEARMHGGTDELEMGAGDQGIIFGYATDETPEYLPAALSFSHRLTRQMTYVRKKGIIPYLLPDGKAQVTIELDDNNELKRIHTIVISAQHKENVTMEQLYRDIHQYIIRPVIPTELLDSKTIYYINPTGKFVIGGPAGDSGLTGRKIIVDTYGGIGHHGGGAFSGKDPSKVDRSGAYAARWVAKNLVAAGVAKKLEIEIAYVIGVASPVSLSVNSFGTGIIPDEEILEIIEKVFDLRPASIIKELNLKYPMYKETASYGHFGRTDIDLPWERINRVEEIQKILGNNR